jgi:predicted HTH transcriptional regulator
LNGRDILLRLTNTEDATVERKTASDYRDCLKTAVAFSNSLPVDDPGIIFVGVGKDGTIQGNNTPLLNWKGPERWRDHNTPVYLLLFVLLET